MSATGPDAPGGESLAVGLGYGLFGGVVTVLGAQLASNSDEAGGFLTLGVALLAVGLFLIVTGAVARGHSVARRK